jgi:hypothetical protein
MATDENTGKTAKDAKAERLAEALRENLRKRKAQARERKAGAKQGAATDHRPKDGH